MLTLIMCNVVFVPVARHRSLLPGHGRSWSLYRVLDHLSGHFLLFQVSLMCKDLNILPFLWYFPISVLAKAIYTVYCTDVYVVFILSIIQISINIFLTKYS